jgi:hypothetical protein
VTITKFNSQYLVSNFKFGFEECRILFYCLRIHTFATKPDFFASRAYTVPVSKFWSFAEPSSEIPF